MNKFKFLNFKVLSLILGVVLILSFAGNAIQKNKNKDSNNIQDSESSESIESIDIAKEDKIIEKALIKKASAAEIHPLFKCPCCGKAIGKCSCGMAKERMAFIDGITASEISRDEAVLTYVKKYGLSSFLEDEKQEEFREKLAKEAPDERPIISISPDFYDFGDVSQKKGTVTTFFEIKNEGKTDLVIDRLDSSCGCTSASIVYQGEEGPIFIMAGHGEENPTDWQVVIPSGEKAQLKVYYDPDMHPDFRGAATRTVSVYSDDPIDFQKKITIELNQVD